MKKKIGLALAADVYSPGFPEAFGGPMGELAEISQQADAWLGTHEKVHAGLISNHAVIGVRQKRSGLDLGKSVQCSLLCAAAS